MTKLQRKKDSLGFTYYVAGSWTIAKSNYDSSRFTWIATDGDKRIKCASLAHCRAVLAELSR